MTKKVVWSREQEEVIASSHSPLVVTAAAGAGKTLVLVARYLRHVEAEGLGPDQILTITFTKKAAAEMRRRIVESLRERGLDDHAQVAETGPIQTIHSFCERLLRENSLEAGLDPNFEILSEGQGARLVTRCIRETLASSLEDEPQGEQLIALLAGKTRPFGANRSPYARLEEAIAKVLDGLRSSGADLEKVAERHQSPRALREYWEDSLTRMQPEPVRFALSSIEGASLQERLQYAYKMLDLRQPAYLKGRPDQEAEDQALLHTCGLVQLACAAWRLLDRELHIQQALDFNGLESRAVRLLERSEVTRERVRHQYRVVMVDEAQDVNPVQYRLLDRLGAAQTMMVGDAQQSIYGFRHADVELFRDRAGLPTSKRLTRNYRSKPGILNFVDLVFGDIWKEQYVPMSERPTKLDLDDDSPIACEGVEIWKQEKNDWSATAQFVKALLDDSKVKPGETAILVRDGTGAAAMKAALEAVDVEAKIAGGAERFYTRLEVRDLANALRAVADPSDDFALLACLRSPMVGLSLDSIVMLGKQEGVAQILATFEPPIPEDRAKIDQFLAWYEPMTRYSDRLSAWEVLSELFAKSEYLPALARRKDAMQLLANARKLLALATQEADLGPLEYAERIREIQDLRHKEGDAPAGEDEQEQVTIMTVHKSKGLEFGAVVVPQTDKSLINTNKDVVIEPRIGLVVTKFGAGQSLVYKYLSADRKDREYQEELRVLYVALTRAKERLCVVLSAGSGRTQTVSKMLNDMFGSSWPNGVVVRQPREDAIEADVK
jgi:ATP-dependent exoDNAse (exonuclease V) beta subunit